jgi:hypothetical protein
MFDVSGRGCFVLILDGEIASDIVLRIGDEAAVVSEGSDPIRTRVKGLEAGHRPGSGFVGVLLGPEVTASDVRPGSSLMKEETSSA